MLHDFIVSHRQQILDRVEANLEAQFPRQESTLGALPAFLDHLVVDLRAARGAAAAPGEPEVRPGRDLAVFQGQNRHRAGLPINAVVQCFGALCEAITGSAADENLQFEARDFQLLNQGLDAAIAVAISEYATLSRRDDEAKAAERVGFLAHEMRNALASATFAYDALREGHVAAQSKTAEVLGRNLHRLESLIGHALAAARLQAGVVLRTTTVSIAEVLQEIEADLPAGRISVGIQVEATLAIEADRDLFSSAVGNLVQNAIKFTKPGGHVTVRTQATQGYVVIEVEDECGGLPTGDARQLFAAFHQCSPQRTGVGLGLAIAREAVEAHGGSIEVRDIPGKGCAFSLRWPASARRSPAP